LLDFTTCDRNTTSDTILSGILGSLLFQADQHCVITDGSKEVACNNDLGAACANAPLASDIPNAGGNGDGILTVNVDTAKVNTCGPYILGSMYK
jgi:hypothetical protein